MTAFTTFKGSLGWYWLDNRHPDGHAGPFLNASLAIKDWKVFNAAFSTLRQRPKVTKNPYQSVKSV